MHKLIESFLHVDSEGPSPVGIVYPIASQNLTVEQSESVTLECVISGSPSSKVKWTKDGSELMLSSKQMLLHSNLVLNDIHLSDRGHYCCSVLTDNGDVVSVNYTVNVLGMQRFDTYSSCTVFLCTLHFCFFHVFQKVIQK